MLTPDSEATDDCNKNPQPLPPNPHYSCTWYEDTSRINVARPNSSENPYYFYRNGEPIMLVGISDRYILRMQGSRNGFTWQQYLDDLSEHGINYARIDVTSWDPCYAPDADWYFTDSLPWFHAYASDLSDPGLDPIECPSDGCVLPGQWDNCYYDCTAPPVRCANQSCIPRSLQSLVCQDPNNSFRWSYSYKYDMGQLCDTYKKKKLEAFVQYAASRTPPVYVELTLFENSGDMGHSIWEDSFNINNYGLSPGDAESKTTDANLNGAQEFLINLAWVCTAPAGNVMYEICNEGGGQDWVTERIHKIKVDQDTYQKPIIVGQGPLDSPYDLFCGCNDVYLKHRDNTGQDYRTNADVANHRAILIGIRSDMSREGHRKPIIHDESFLFKYDNCDACRIDFIRKMTWANVTGGGHSCYYDYVYWRGGGEDSQNPGQPERLSQTPPSRLNMLAKDPTNNCCEPETWTAPIKKTAVDELGYITGFFKYNGIPFEKMAPSDDLVLINPSSGIDTGLSLSLCSLQGQDATAPCIVDESANKIHRAFVFATENTGPSTQLTHLVAYILNPEEGGNPLVGGDPEQCGMVYLKIPRGSLDPGVVYQLKWYDPQEGNVICGPSPCLVGGSNHVPLNPVICTNYVDCTTTHRACIGASRRCGGGEYAGFVGDQRLGITSPVQLVTVPTGEDLYLRTPWFTRDLVLLISTGSKSKLLRSYTSNPTHTNIAAMFPLQNYIPNFISGDIDPQNVLTDTQKVLVLYQTDAPYNSLVMVKFIDSTHQTVRIYF